MRKALIVPTVLFVGCGSGLALAQDATPRAALQAAFGGPAVEAAARFEYRLTVADAQGRTLRDNAYALLPESRRLYARDTLAVDSPQVWSDPAGSWRLAGAQWEYLSPAAAAPFRQHVAYHFLALFRDPATEYGPVAAGRLRLTPSGAAPFEVRLDPASGRILENHFDSGTFARELDYRRVGNLWWPMAYEVVVDGAVTRRGRFSATAVSAQAALPAMPVTDAAPALPEDHDDVARLVGAGWLSGPGNDYNLSVDATGRTLVFARSQPDFKQSRIWIARHDGTRWGVPQPVPFTDPRYRDSDPWLTPDGRTLYFVSDRPVRGDAPREDLDVWRVALRDDGFGVPEHLAALSSAGEELGPELHDGWLYFNSSRPGGPARLSIYRARVRAEVVETPQALGAPFNDGRAQGDFTLSPDGRVAVFWSQRGESRDADLFAVRREGDGWSQAVRLPAPINAPGFDFTPAFSADGRSLRLASMRKPAWIDDPAHVFNGQANVYTVPAAQVHRAFEASDAP